MKEEIFYSAKYDMLFIVFLYSDRNRDYMTFAENSKGVRGLDVMVDIYGDLDYIGDL